MDRDIKRFVIELKKYRGILPKQTIKTLRGQALSGNLEGARKGLKKITKEVSI
jgi:hypothetical protein